MASDAHNNGIVSQRSRDIDLFPNCVLFVFTEVGLNDEESPSTFLALVCMNPYPMIITPHDYNSPLFLHDLKQGGL